MRGHEQACYSLLEGPPLRISHHGETVTITTEPLAARPIPPPPAALLGCAR